MVRRVAIGALASILGLAVGVVLLGGSGPGTETADDAVPARSLGRTSSTYGAAVDAALVHAQSTVPSGQELRGEVVLRFPGDDDRVMIRITGGEFCRVYTAHRLTSHRPEGGSWQVPSTRDGASCTA